MEEIYKTVKLIVDSVITNLRISYVKVASLKFFLNKKKFRFYAAVALPVISIIIFYTCGTGYLAQRN